MASGKEITKRSAGEVAGLPPGLKAGPMGGAHVPIYIPERRMQSMGYSDRAPNGRLVTLFRSELEALSRSRLDSPGMVNILGPIADTEGFEITNRNLNLFRVYEIEDMPVALNASRFKYDHIDESELRQELAEDFDEDFQGLVEEIEYEPVSVLEKIENGYTDEDVREINQARKAAAEWKAEFPMTHSDSLQEIHDRFNDIMRDYNSFDSDEYNVGSMAESRNFFSKKNAALNNEQKELKRMYKTSMGQRLRAKKRSTELSKEDLEEGNTRNIHITKHLTNLSDIRLDQSISANPEDFDSFEEYNTTVAGEIELYESDVPAEEDRKTNSFAEIVDRNNLLNILNSESDDAPELTYVEDDVDFSILDNPEQRRKAMMDRISRRTTKAINKRYGPILLEEEFDEIDDEYGVVTSKKEARAFWNDFQLELTNLATA